MININTKYFANYFTDMLNRYGAEYGKKFKIFADEGELKRAFKEYGKKPQEFTSGVAEIVSSGLSPVQDLRLDTYSVQITLYVDLAMDGFNEDKESLNLIAIRDLLTKFIDEQNGVSSMENGINITMSVGYPTTGSKGEVGFISDCLTLYLNASFVMFQNGLNANNCSIEINGTKLPFTKMAFSRVRTAEQNTFNGEESTRTTIQAQGLSVDLSMPALTDNEFSKLVMKDVLDGSNEALCVKIKTPLYSKLFIGTFGNTTASLELAINVGYNISIVETVEDILDYGENWEVKTELLDIYKHDGNENSEFDYYIFFSDGHSVFIDGTKDYEYKFKEPSFYTIRKYKVKRNS